MLVSNLAAHAAGRYGHRRAMKEELERLRHELRALLDSWEYAFAMGHSCTIGDHADSRAVRQRAADLKARIAELSH